MEKKLSREELQKRYEKKLEKQEYLLKKIAYLKDRVAILDKCDAELRRAARTHRLCTRGGMLERELREPEMLTDIQVEELIRAAFAEEKMQKMLQHMLDEAYLHPEQVNL